jgi:hypothetical protein
MSKNKPRVIKDYEKLSPEIKEQIKLMYPNGFSENLITYTDKTGKIISSLPFETPDTYYLVKMTMLQATTIVEDDEDYDEDGILKDEVKEEYKEKYLEIDDTEDADEYPDEKLEEGDESDEEEHDF